MEKLPKKLLVLNAQQLEELKLICQHCLILGGLETCSCSSLDLYVQLTKMSKASLLNWYKTYDKNFWNELKKRT